MKCLHKSLICGAITGFLIINPVFADDYKNPEKDRSAGVQNSRTGDMQRDQDMRASMRPDQLEYVSAESAQEIRHMLGDTVSAIMSGDLENFRDKFSESDRERLSSFNESVSEKLSQDARAYNDKFESKFEEINWDDEEELDAVFNYEIKKNEPREDRQRVALEIPSSQGGQSSTLTLVNEGTVMDAWRIDVPDNVSAQQLESKLSQTLKKLSQHEMSGKERIASARQAANQILSVVSSNSRS